MEFVCVGKLKLRILSEQICQRLKSMPKKVKKVVKISFHHVQLEFETQHFDAYNPAYHIVRRWHKHAFN